MTGRRWDLGVETVEVLGLLLGLQPVCRAAACRRLAARMLLMIQGIDTALIVFVHGGNDVELRDSLAELGSKEGRNTWKGDAQVQKQWVWFNAIPK